MSRNNQRLGEAFFNKSAASMGDTGVGANGVKCEGDGADVGGTHSGHGEESMLPPTQHYNALIGDK